MDQVDLLDLLDCLGRWLLLLLVLAALAFAELGAACSGIVAFAVTFEAVGFLAMTALLAVTALSFSGQLSHLFHHLLFIIAVLHVFAGKTSAVLSTPPRGGIALTVHLKTKSLLTVASQLPLLSGGSHRLLDRTPFRKGVFLELWCVNELRDLNIFGNVGWKDIDCVYHLEALMHLGHIGHWWKKIEDFFGLFGHRSVENRNIIKLIKIRRGEDGNIGIERSHTRNWLLLKNRAIRSWKFQNHQQRQPNDHANPFLLTIHFSHKLPNSHIYLLLLFPP